MIDLGDFLGVWRLHREIEDVTGTANGTFEGEAVFAAVDADRLNYREAGMLVLAGGQKMRAERGYVWRRHGTGIEVLFADGRPFHQFDPGAATCAEHWCDPDMYRVVYDFADWPNWQSRWTVSGPKKSYGMISDYRR